MKIYDNLGNWIDGDWGCSMEWALIFFSILGGCSHQKFWRVLEKPTSKAINNPEANKSISINNSRNPSANSNKNRTRKNILIPKRNPYYLMPYKISSFSGILLKNGIEKYSKIDWVDEARSFLARCHRRTKFRVDFKSTENHPYHLNPISRKFRRSKNPIGPLVLWAGLHVKWIKKIHFKKKYYKKWKLILSIYIDIHLRNG